MKVALLSDCYLPRLGGIEVQVHDLARHLVEAGHEVEAFTATPGDGPQRSGTEVIDGIPVHRLSMRLPGDIPINPFAPLQLKQMLQDGKFDVAHAHMGVISPFSMDCVRVTLGIGLPTAVTWHCVLWHAAHIMKPMGYVGRWASRGVALSAVSSVAAEPLHKLAGDDARVAVLHNGIDITRWVPAERVPDGVIRVVTAMRLARRKRPAQLLEVIRHARELSPTSDIRLEVLGEGTQRGTLEKWIAEHNAGSWVSLPGRVSRNDLHKRYLASDMYIAPAELEAFGIAALEARTSGLPVVSPARSGVSDFVTDEVNGLLTDNDHGMAEAVARLAQDAPLRERMRRHNVESPPEQSWPKAVERTVAEYERAISLRRGS